MATLISLQKLCTSYSSIDLEAEIVHKGSTYSEMIRKDIKCFHCYFYSWCDDNNGCVYSNRQLSKRQLNE